MMEPFSLCSFSGVGTLYKHKKRLPLDLSLYLHHTSITQTDADTINTWLGSLIHSLSESKKKRKTKTCCFLVLCVCFLLVRK